MAVRVTREVGRPLNALRPLTDWTVDVANWVENYLISNNRRATGNTINSLEVVITRPNEVEFRGADSLKWALGGRTSGGWPPVNKIRDWIQAKGITSDLSLNSLTFLIGRKIAEQGTNPPKLVPQNIAIVINSKSRKYLNEIGDIQAKEASEAMIKLLTKIPNTTEK